MTDVLFCFDVEAAPEEVLQALKTTEGIKGFWTSRADAPAEVGEMLEVGFAIAPLPFDLRLYVDAHDVPFTLECLLHVRPDGFLLLGEAPRKQDEAFQEEVRNAARTLMEAVTAKREGRLVTAGTKLKEPRPK